MESRSKKMSGNSASKIMQYLVQMQGRKSNIFRPFILKTGGKTEIELVIAEKPSVAISIAKVIGATKKRRIL